MNWLKANWKSALLVSSLALNLLVAGMILSHSMMQFRGNPGRIQATSWSQLLPRGFFVQLDNERRHALLGSFKAQHTKFREGRSLLRARAAAVADALEADPYDLARVQTAVAQFGDAGKGIIDEGSNGVNGVIAKLSADERKILAAEIRRRAGGGKP